MVSCFYISLCESGSPTVMSNIRLSTGTDTPLSLTKKLDMISDKPLSAEASITLLLRWEGVQAQEQTLGMSSAFD